MHGGYYEQKTNYMWPKDQQPIFNNSLDFYIIFTKFCYKGWSDYTYLLSKFMQVFFSFFKSSGGQIIEIVTTMLTH